MKIAFLGDSITEGIPKVSYVDIVDSKTEHEVFNYGKGGDTVMSLHKRVKKISLDKYDVLVLFVGVNDVYSKINKTHQVFKKLRRQIWVKSREAFYNEYESLIQYLNSYKKDIVVIPPLLFGENITNQWNVELKEFCDDIKVIVNQYNHITYLDVRSEFIEYLKDKEISEYIPYSLMQTIKDVSSLKTNELVDQKSRERGLHLTLDGCHLNSRGASIVSTHLLNYFNEIEK